jgi:hypothetical protein
MGNTLGLSESGRSSDPCIAYWQDAVESRKGQFAGLDCEDRGGCVTGGYAGASGSMVGGIDDLTAEYDTTVSSKAKRDLIKKLSDGISRALKVSPPSSGASNDEMVSHLLSIVPNPRKGKSIVADKGKQEKLCQDVADVINTNYGKVIDKSLGPDGVCNQVSDIVESLSAGLNQEYVAVAASVERSLGNLQDLKEMLERSYTKLYNESANSDDEALKINIMGIKSVHDLLMQEVQRQLAILSNLTRTNLRDNQRELSQLLAENKDFKGLVESIKTSLGTSEWGDKLGFWLSGVNNVAQMALRVDKALKIIGMKSSEYKNASKLSDLTMKTHELMEKMPANKLTRDYIDKYEKAIEIIKKHHGHHSEIAKMVKGAGYKGGNVSLESSIGSFDSGEYDGAYEGGVMTLKKKLNMQGQTRMILLKDFKAKCTVLMDRVYQSIFRAGRRIGSGHVKLSDDLYRFKTVLGDLSLIFREGIEYALTGYYSHANAVQHKDRFLGLLTSMLHVLDSLKSQDESFREISANIESVMKLVDFFNDKFKVHTGHTAPDRSGASEGGKLPNMNLDKLKAGMSSFATSASSVLDAAPGAIENFSRGVAGVRAQGDSVVAAASNAGAYEGSYEADGGGEFKAVVTLQNAKNTFTHFYSVAKFKVNLQTAAGEMKKYDEKYTTVVGSAVGIELTSLKEKLNTEIEELGKGGGFTGTTPNDGYKIDLIAINEAGVRGNIGLGHDSEIGLAGMGSKGEWDVGNIKELLTSQVQAKEKLYKVAQAVDEYLQKFTDSVAASPEDVQEVAKLLGNVEIMANWFNEKSGDSIASLYEVFPWTIVGMRTFMNVGLQEKTCGVGIKNTNMRTLVAPSRHYYQEIAATQSEGTQGVARGAGAVAAPAAGLPPIGADVRRIGVGFMIDYVNLQGGSGGKTKSGMPGVPFFPISPARALYAKRFAKYAIDKVYVLKNIVSAFAYLGRKFGGVDLTKGTFMSPNDMYKCLTEYLYTSAFVNGWKDGIHERYYGLQKTGTTDRAADNGGAVYAPPISYTAAADTFTGAAHAATATPSMATDSAAAVILGFRIGPYLTPRVISNGGNGGNSEANGLGDESKVNTITPGDMGRSAGAGIWPTPGTGVDREIVLKQVSKVRYKYSWAMAGIDERIDGLDSAENSMSGWNNVFKKEDRLFVHIIKAMAAKVFTVTGLYNMLNFGDKIKSYSLSPARLILGGGKSGGDSYTYDTPKIYPEAVALYARLPLLAEFYRDIFCFEEPCSDDSDDVAARTSDTSKHLLISMVPEVGSLWSGFIKTIFDQPMNTNGLYTDNVLKRIIHEINGIYQTYKNKGGDVVSTIISEFVAEINGRYGLMNRGEITKYKNEEDKRINIASYGNTNEYGPDPDDFDILDVDNIGNGVAPSDRYVNVKYTAAISDHSLDPKMYEALKIFRRRIDKRISDVLVVGGPDPYGRREQYDKHHFRNVPDFGRLIMSTQDTLKTTESSDEQYKLISRMMVGMDVQTQTDTDASIMFHESVVTPLAALTTITTMLKNYQEEVRKWNAPALYRSIVAGINDGGIDKIINANFPVHDALNLGDSPGYGRLKIWVDKDRNISTENPDDAKETISNLIRLGAEEIPVLFMGRVGGATNVGTLTDTYRADPADAATPLGLKVESIFDTDIEKHRGWTNANHMAYLLIRWEALFKHITRAVSGLTADLGSLCDVQFANGRMIINHTGLQTVCEEVFATVRKNMDKFRGVIDNNKLQPYEMNTRTGSVSWVQEHLIDNLFGDQDRKSGLKRAHQIVTESYLLLSNRNPDGGPASYFGANSRTAGPLNKNTIRKQGWCVNGVLAEFTHYHSSTMASDAANGVDSIRNAVHRFGARLEPLENFATTKSLKGVLMSDSPLEHLMHSNPQQIDTTTGQLSGRTQRIIEQQWSARFDYYLQYSANGAKNAGFRGDNNKEGDEGERILYNDDNDKTYNQASPGKIDIGMGLMMRFNEVMAQYLIQFWDPTMLKIYSPLLEVPANGPLNQECFKMLGWPDVVHGASNAEQVRFLVQNIKTQYPGAAGDITAKSLIDRIGELNGSNKSMSDFKGLPLDLDIDMITPAQGNVRFAAHPLDIFSMYIKMSLGAIAPLARGTTIGDIVGQGVIMQNNYADAVVANAANWGGVCTAADPGIAGYDGVWQVLHDGNYRQDIGTPFTSVQATSIIDIVTNLEEGKWPATGGGPAGNYWKIENNANVVAWKATINRQLGNLYRTSSAGNITSASMRTRVSTMAASVLGVLAGPADAAKQLAVVNAWNSLPIREYTIAGVPVAGGIVTTLDDVVGVAAAAAGVGGQTPMQDLTAYYVVLAAIVQSGQTTLAGLGLGPAGAGAAAPADIIGSDLTADAMHGQILKRLYIMKRSIIKRLNGINFISANWRQDFSTSVGAIAADQVTVFTEAEKKRLNWVFINHNVRPLMRANGDDVWYPWNSTLSDAASTWINERATTRAAQFAMVANDYATIVKGLANNIRFTPYEIVMAVTLCIEPLTVSWATSNANWGVAATTAAVAVNGYSLFLDKNHPYYTKNQQLGLNRQLAILGFCPGTYDTMFTQDTVAGARNFYVDASAREFRGELTSNQQEDHPLFSNLVTNAAAWVNNTFVTTGYSNGVDGEWNGTLPPTPATLSRMVGAGISDILNNTAISPIDVMDISVGIVGGGLNAFQGPVGSTYDVAQNSVVVTQSNRWVTTITQINILNRNDLPDPPTVGMGDPKYILFASLSKAINGALTEVNRTGVKMNVTQSIAEVPIRMKEAMKCQLPIFNELFKMINKNAGMLKGFIKLGIGCDRIADTSPVVLTPLNGVHGGVTAINSRNEVEGSQWYTTFLDKITNACETMSTTIEGVINELNDAPLYLEVGDNSIIEYKNRNVKMPFMPLSSMTVVLQPGHRHSSHTNWPTNIIARTPVLNAAAHPRRDANLGYPGTSPGNPMFMYNYGTRLLLHDYNTKPLIEHMPGVKELVSKYNMVTKGQRQIDEKTYSQFAGKIVELFRYLHASRLYAPLVNGDRRLIDDSWNDQLNIYQHMTYQLTKPLSVVIELTTGSDHTSNVSTVASFINGTDGNDISRNSSIIYNILDLNISPINIHAMRREIPLINLYNYAHTFDSFVTEIVQSTYVGHKGKDETLGPDAELNTHDVLVGLCKNPYIRVPQDVWYNKLQSMIKGESSVDMYGYPKFISDQLWGKALLQDSVAAAGNAPPTSRNIRRIDTERRPVGVPTDIHGMIYQDSQGRVIRTKHIVGQALPGGTGRVYLAELGRLRFDTKFARNLMFLANVQRIMMHKINTELTSIPYPVASGPSVTNREITDYRDGETHSNLSID